MPVPTSGLGGQIYGRAKRNYNYDTNAIMGDADIYRKALEKAAYGDAGQEYGAGLKGVTDYLAGSGPMADGGAGTALRTKLYSDIYGKARSKVQGGYSEYLAQLLQQRRNFIYQQRLAELMKKGGTGVGGVVGGLAGSFLGPFAGAVGKGLGERLIA
jgi:hypothetical protein